MCIEEKVKENNTFCKVQERSSMKEFEKRILWKAAEDNIIIVSKEKD